MVTKKVTVVWTQEIQIDVANEATDQEIEEMAIKNAKFVFSGDDPIVIDIQDVEELKEEKK